MQAKEKCLVFGRFTQANNVALGMVTKISNLTHFHKSHLKLVVLAIAQSSDQSSSSNAYNHLKKESFHKTVWSCEKLGTTHN